MGQKVIVRGWCVPSAQGVRLERPEFLLRYKTPQRTALDGMCLRKNQRPPGAGAERGRAPEAESTGERLQQSRQRHGTAPGSSLFSAKPGIGGGGRVESVKLKATPSSATRLPKPLIPTQEENKARVLTRAAATATSAAGSGGGGGGGGGAASASTTNFVKATANTKTNNSTAAAHTAPSGTPLTELETVKRWKDDEAHLELRTVASVASTSQRPVPSVKECEIPLKQCGTPVKQLVTKRLSTGFTVTPCSKSIGAFSKWGRTEGPVTDHTQNKGSITVVEEKREWSTDMFMQSDICTVMSEQTTPPLNTKGDAGIQKPTSVSTPSNSSLGAPSAVQSPLCSSAKKKAEVLQQLRQLREENRRALKAALNHRRTWK
ncbi:hypothetical protein TraAM80_02719 [Trypanosoma rangeli]|uniref:Uncharacterized protein n=1 Tax=Trypanosoma rangeli TaxID=5698 RepID=A0A3R7NVR5_TRYRA|nr:uncharacterized protein TraAM80_02719 [Trypanosoma rangeli]RNF08493.1 hypothetical protein TraAM80_02719 [Trypanosoma rangeli]|eukprot:RNF08493.1 hypothetical protein TraAM80_02719 [Trypanosoma rangeli]